MKEHEEVDFEGSIALMAGQRGERKPVFVYHNKRFFAVKRKEIIIITQLSEGDDNFQIAFEPTDRWAAHDNYVSIGMERIPFASPPYVMRGVVTKYKPNELRIQ